MKWGERQLTTVLFVKIVLNDVQDDAICDVK